MEKVKLELFSTLFDNHTIPDFYSSICYSDNHIINNSSQNPFIGNKVYSVNLVPSYLNVNLSNEHLLNIKKIPQFNWGYAIFLNSSSHAGDYLKNHFKNNFRTKLNKAIRRLETCFNISYKMFYGEINIDDYHHLMGTLRIMLVNRFKEINETNNNLSQWKELHKKTLPLIYEKKASLFVIYDGDKPIDISLNYHLDKILFSSISSYDLDYSKFSLGNIAIFKQLEWCFLNNYQVFEMGVGGMDYKRRWSNNIYNYEHHIYYNKSLLSKCYAFFEISKIKLKEYLKAKQIPVYIQKARSVLSFNKEIREKALVPLKIENYDAISVDMDLVKINLQGEAYSHIRKHVYDFLYGNPENITKVEVFKIDGENSYRIKGSDKQIKVTF